MLNQEQIGAYIAARRKAVGLTQAELGERLGITAQSVSNWERGETMPDTGLFHWFSSNFFRYYHFFRRFLTFRDNCPVRFQDIRQRPDSSRFLCCRCRKCRQKRLHLRHTDNTEHSGKHCRQRFFPNFHVILLVLLFLSHLSPAPKMPAGDSARRQCGSGTSRLSVRAGTDAARCTA